MDRKPPIPICSAFLACRQIIDDKQCGDYVLVGQSKSYQHHFFPCAVSIAFFARLTSVHGDYRVEVQLLDEHGEIVWRDGPLHTWSLADPLEMYDIKFELCPVFLRPAVYTFVLAANGEEVARQRYTVKPTPQPAPLP